MSTSKGQKPEQAMPGETTPADAGQPAPAAQPDNGHTPDKQVAVMSGPALWQGRTFTYGSLTITVQRKTVGSMMRRDSIRSVLEDSASDGILPFVQQGFVDFFAQIVTQTVQVEGPLTLPSPTASPDELRAAFEDFNTWDGNLLDLWVGELRKVNRPPGDPVYWPKEHLTEAELKKMPSAG